MNAFYKEETVSQDYYILFQRVNDAVELVINA